MNKLLFTSMLVLSSLIISCNGSSGGGSSGDSSIAAASVSPFDGQAYFLSATNSTNTKIIGFSFSGNNAVYISGVVDLATNKVTYRKNIGTFTFSGNKYIFSWSYETCNPVHTDTVLLSSTDVSDYIMMTEEGSPTTYKFYNDKKYISSSLNFRNLSVYTEDVQCNLMTRLEKTDSRIPASASHIGRQLEGLKIIEPKKN